MEYINKIFQGDCGEILKGVPDNSVDLIFTSPPYADQRKNTYGGIKPDEYVNWFLPKAAQFLRVLKVTGTFILNIKERVVEGERHTYVIELIMEMRKQGWLWTEEFMWHKKIHTRGSGLIDSEIIGRGSYSSIKPRNLICIRNLLWFQ
jgi:site-specific DNA-methyltransferase (adenine-specific)